MATNLPKCYAICHKQGASNGASWIGKIIQSEQNKAGRPYHPSAQMVEF